MARFFSQMFTKRNTHQLPVFLTSRVIYILPTRSGLVLGLLTLSVLIAAINYTNNLAFFLAFLLISIGLVSALHAFASLHGLCVQKVRSLPGFCGEEIQVCITLYAEHRQRSSVQLYLTQKPKEEYVRTLRLRPQGVQDCSVGVVLPKRGMHKLPRLTLETRFPLGIFRAWSPVYVQDVFILVYPRSIPAEQRSLEYFVEGISDFASQHSGQGGDFCGIRPYRAGDSLGRISWKSSARGAGLMSKESTATQARMLFFDWEALPGIPYEERISRLTGMLREAERQQYIYGLAIPGARFDPGSGAEHMHRCLEALALMPEEL